MDEGPYKVTKFRQTPNTGVPSTAVRLRAIRSVVERETTQTAS